MRLAPTAPTSNVFSVFNRMNPAAQKTVRFGLIGCGAWGIQHASAIAKTPGAELAAIADSSEQSRETARTAYGKTVFYADYRQMLAREKLDVAAIVLPSHLHYEAAKASLAAGSHLLMEKPLCLRLDHCDELITQANESGLLLAVVQQFRLSSLWGKIKELVNEGAIGDPRYCLIDLWRNPFRLGTDGWRYDLSRSGSWILEEAIHFFDLARWYFEKAGDPVSVFASASHQRNDRPELQDHFSATLQFPNGGYAVVSQTLGGYEHHMAVKMSGTKGALWANWSGAMDRTLHPAFSLKYFDGKQVQDLPITRTPGEVFELEDQLADMISAVRGAKLRGATGRDGRWAVEMCLKAQDSVKTGTLVRF